ncbi:MAG: hypothetical protein ABI619_08350, partial [Betaproteobacteria bacterium]
TLISTATFGQTENAPLSLDVAQQRARFARAQMIEAEQKFKTAEKKDKSARRNLEEAKIEAEQAAKTLQDTHAEVKKWRDLHDQAYQDLRRAHEAMQELTKPQ